MEVFMRRSLIVITPLLALSLAVVACDEAMVDGPNSVAEVEVESAVISRCNQMMEFSEFHFTLTVTNTGALPLALGGVAFEGRDGVATYVAGTTTLSSPVVIAAGESARFSCSPDVPLTWQTDAAAALLSVGVAVSHPDGSDGATASGEAALQFVEAWDSCDTYAGQRHPCTPIPFN
ncbi:MAG: hypothetical protein CVU56_17390 [Deltaproteobacteria bacterium HGW-Deltaproteobacteria-14]|nr:MAG: hypothetical protein CVU56_17390 [Deltaproteobacteria bacterium HGW-Deltaproteobacteria-14]